MQKERNWYVWSEESGVGVRGQQERMEGMRTTLKGAYPFIFAISVTYLSRRRLRSATRRLIYFSPMSTESPIVRCPGCRRIFTPRGLCQHISKTQRSACRPPHELQPTANTASSSTLAPNADSRDTTRLNDGFPEDIDGNSFTPQTEHEGAPPTQLDDGMCFAALTPAFY